MIKKVKTILLDLVLNQIDKKEIKQDVKNLINDELLNALYCLSKMHDVAHLVANALESNGLLPKETNIRFKFLKEREISVFRSSQFLYDFSSICNAFENAGIDFLPLKGSVINSLYPEPWMRTSCDIDILVREEDVDLAISTLKEKLNFTTDGFKTTHDVSLFSTIGTRIELHFSLIEGKDNSYLANVWEKTIIKNGYKHWNLLLDEAFYLYHIKHMVKHFEEGGCGIKPFIDLWLLYKQKDVRQKSLQLIRKEGFEKFENAVYNLVTVWFNGKEPDEMSERLESYILKGGVYGSIENRVATQQVQKGGKIKYLLSRIFLSYNELSIKYPRLKKYPFLFPFYQVKRWFRLIGKSSRRNSLNEFRETIIINDDKKIEISKLLKELGL